MDGFGLGMPDVERRSFESNSILEGMSSCHKPAKLASTISLPSALEIASRLQPASPAQPAKPAVPAVLVPDRPPTSCRSRSGRESPTWPP